MEELYEKGVVVYVYGILEGDGKVSYVGKSSSPKARMYAHASSIGEKGLRVVILDSFRDTENYWIKKLSQEGNRLFNRQVDPMEESWNVGDIIGMVRRSDRKVLDKRTGIIYRSRNHYHTETGISYSTIKAILENPLHKLSEKYLIEYID